MTRPLQCLAVAGLLAGGGSPLEAIQEPGYVTSARCGECHADAYDAWADSHHGWAWRPPIAGNVLGDFEDAVFTHRGALTRFSTRDGRFVVDTDDAQGKRASYEIAGTVGVTPLQQYLIETEGGRLQALDVVWDTERRRWYHLYPEQRVEDDPALHWTGPYRNWNARCVSCHVTGFAKGYDPETDRYASSWSERGVGCEACHGPGEAHLAWAEAGGAGPTTVARFDGVDARGLTVSFAGGGPEAYERVCAGCHSRRETLSADSPPPGEPFDDHYRIALLRDGLYYADGQIDDEVYVYGSFLQSKMHARGVSCGDCHQPHGAGLVAEGDALCTQCHNPQGREDFPTLRAASYVSPVHHRHRSGTEASSCVSCHMPERVYMGVDPRRDHSFRVPRPDLSVKLDVPNACNGCHTEETPEWAAARVAEWFPQGHHLRPHYAEALAAGRRRLDADSAAGLLDLAMDVAQPAIARATALEMLARVAATPELAGAALPLLDDDSPWVRAAALGLFDGAPATARAKHAGPLLDDPSRTVRVAAARRILDVGTGGLNASDRAIVERAVGEYRASLEDHADFPEVQLNLSRFAEIAGDLSAARRALETAVRLDPGIGEAWLRLAELDVEAGRFNGAHQTLERAVVEAPESGALHQLLGRVRARLGHRAAAAATFKIALDLLPEELEVRIEYVSLLTHLGRYRKALDTLARAGAAALDDPQVLYLLSYNHALLEDMERARHFARELESRHPESPLNPHLQSFLENPDPPSGAHHHAGAG